MPETASLETHEASPPPAARRDVRVVTTEQLRELRREQQEIYLSLRSSGLDPSDAARQIGIPRSLADQWERSASSAPASTASAVASPSSAVPAPAPAGASPAPAPIAPAAPARNKAAAKPRSTSAAQSPAATRPEGSASPAAAQSPAAGGQSPPGTRRPAPAKSGSRSGQAQRAVRPNVDTGDLARQARESTQRLQRELAVLRRILKRLEAANAPPAETAGSPAPQVREGTRTSASAPEGAASMGIPQRAARSSLTTVLLARGRARQHPAPSSRT